jgi:simple sugar transport system permease protein
MARAAARAIPVPGMLASRHQGTIEVITKDTKVAAQAAERPTSSVLTGALGTLLRFPETSIVVVAIIVALVFQVLNQAFLTSLVPVLGQKTALYGLIAIGEAMLMITGEIDLSAAKIYSTTPFIAYYLTQAGLPFGVGILLALCGAALIGMVNGLVTVRIGVPSLIATLGMLFFLNGLTLSVSKSEPVLTPVEEPFNTFLGLGQQQPIGGLATHAGFLWLVFFTIILAVVLRRTRFGTYTISVGSNLLAAREIGIRTQRVKVMNFMIMGFLAGFNGIIEAAASGSIDPSAGDNSLTLYGIAAAVIGGTSLFGGSGTVVGAVIGSFVIAALVYGLPLVGAQATTSDLILGIAIVVAITLNIYLTRLQARRARQ